MGFTNPILNLFPEPMPAYKFQVYLQLMCLGFSKITNIEESIETEPLQEGGVNDRVYSLTKPITAERTLLMERGVANRGALNVLLSSQFAVGQRIHTDILIIANKRDGSIGKIFEVHGAVVKKLTFSPLDSMSGEVMIETFELAYETLENLRALEMYEGTAGSAFDISTFF